MIGLIIFGTKGVTSTVSTGAFDCPGCSASTHYEHKKLRRFFTLYWIPLIPLGTIAEYVECLSCHGQFKLGVLPGGTSP